MRAANPSPPGSATADFAVAIQPPGPRPGPSPLLPERFVPPIARWSETGLDIAALLFFPLLVLLPRGTAALVSAAGLCACGLMLAAGRARLSRTLAAAAVVLGSLLLWGAFSAFWSVDPLRSLAMSLRLAGLSVVGLALAGAAGLVVATRRLGLLLIIGMAFGIAIVAIEMTTDGKFSSVFSDRAFWPTQLNQASISFALLMLPVSATLICLGQPIIAMLFATAVAAMVYGLAGTAAKVVLVFGLAVGLLLYRARPMLAWVALVVSVLTIITAPLTFARLERLSVLGEIADSVKISAGHRLLIWSFAGDRIAERPLTGWGLDSSRAIPGGEDPIRLGETWMPLHPHNAALQVWLELGAPGAALFALIVAVLWSAVARVEWPPLFVAAAGSGLAIALVGCFTTYGIWQEWWLGTLSFSLFLVLVMGRLSACASARRRITK